MPSTRAVVPAQHDAANLVATGGFEHVPGRQQVLSLHLPWWPRPEFPNLYVWNAYERSAQDGVLSALRSVDEIRAATDCGGWRGRDGVDKDRGQPELVGQRG